MRNIFLFIRRHFNLILFFILQVASLLFISRFSKYHHVVFGSYVNEFTSGISSKVTSIRQYFHLKTMNDSLMKCNERLYNQLKSNSTFVEKNVIHISDSIDVSRHDSVFLQYRKFTYTAAVAVSNSVAFENNFIVIDKGSNDGVQPGMGVVDYNNAPVGIVIDISGHYAVVMSLLHKDSHISGRAARGGETGTLSWDGSSSRSISILGIPNSAKVYKGDTIQTSGFSTAFPRGLPIGFVREVLKETSSNNYKLNFTPAADFNNLQYVYVIKNADMQGVTEILKKVNNNPEQP